MSLNELKWIEFNSEIRQKISIFIHVKSFELTWIKMNSFEHIYSISNKLKWIYFNIFELNINRSYYFKKMSDLFVLSFGGLDIPFWHDSPTQSP